MAAVESRNTSQPVDNQSLFVNRFELAVDAALLTVDTMKVRHAQSQPLSTVINTGFDLHNRNYISNFRQARYGHRGDAHIGEASHPGPKRMAHTDAPDINKGWTYSKCTSWNHEDMKSCEACGSVKRPRRTKTGVSAATQTRTAPTSTPTPVLLLHQWRFQVRRRSQRELRTRIDQTPR